jgi:hypothetical protein
MAEPTLEDRVLIRELYDRALWALNNGEPDVVLALHDPEMETDRWDGAKSGVEGAAKAAEAWPSDPVNRTRQHHITTFIVDPDPEGREDHCAVRFYFLVTEVKEPPRIDIRWSCYSRDIVRKVDGKWLIWRRDIKLNHDSTA